MEFRTMYDKQEPVFSNAGDPIKNINAPVLDKYGNKTIEVKGQSSLYAEIQSWRDECDLNILMAKFTNGDRTALMQRVGAYLDLTKVPDNFNDMLNLTTTAKSVFESLPVETKEVFGNNVNNFLANIHTKEFAEVMSKSPEDIRKEKMMASRDFTNTVKESARPIYSNSTDDLVIDKESSGSSLVDEAVELMKRGKLNESK